MYIYILIHVYIYVCIRIHACTNEGRVVWQEWGRASGARRALPTTPPTLSELTTCLS